MNGARSSSGSAFGITESRTEKRGCDLRPRSGGGSFLYCGDRSQGRHYVCNARLVSRCRRVPDRRLLRHERASLRHGRLAHRRFRGRHARAVRGSIGSYRQRAPSTASRRISRAYRAGHAEGVQIYCRESNGFAVGPQRRDVSRRVPRGSRSPTFVAEYNSGRRLHELESALASVDSRIASNYRAQEGIKQELTDIGVEMIAGDTTAEQRVAMVTRSADLGRRYGELTTEIQQLERDRALAERALLDYRATLAAALLTLRVSARTSSRSANRPRRRRSCPRRRPLGRARRSLARVPDRTRGPE